MPRWPIPASDRGEGATCPLFSDPEGDDYRQHRTVPFGKSVRFPEPFSFDLETAEFI
ncbi:MULTISPECIES: hypothetical protein [unclassified Streptomyces]|uniref:hypothetical protein n=1 Tax=Streptomyces sp. SID4913 TaxID=2690266 RepID=UPI00037C978D|nr:MULTISPECIES: hypothetical protein [unclassified Streptomyces]MYY06584.1 hypothetical protein [Streptomyces sp. SID4913]